MVDSARRQGFICRNSLIFKYFKEHFETGHPARFSKFLLFCFFFSNSVVKGAIATARGPKDSFVSTHPCRNRLAQIRFKGAAFMLNMQTGFC